MMKPSSSRKARVSWSEVDLRSASGPIRLALYDRNLSKVAEESGRLKKRLPAGVYLLQASAGNWRKEQFLTLRAGETWVDHAVKIDFETAFPVGREDDVERLHLRRVGELSHRPARSSGSGARFLFMVRSPQARPAGSGMVNVGDLRLFDHRMREIVRFEDIARIEGEEGWAGVCVDLDPGGYCVRWASKSESDWTSERHGYDQSIWLQEGKITGLFTLASSPDLNPRMSGMSVHMRDLDEGFEEYPGSRELERNLASELALEGLRSGEQLLEKERALLDSLLNGKFLDPMLGIIGGHVLLNARQPRWSYFDTVVRNLHKVLPGHPDVVALRLIGKIRRDIASQTRTQPLSWPPMVYQGYFGVLRRDWSEKELVEPDSMVERAAPHLQHRGPWTAWRALAEFEAPSTAFPRLDPSVIADDIEQLSAKLETMDSERLIELAGSLSPAAKRVAKFIRQVPMSRSSEAAVDLSFEQTGLTRRAVSLALGQLTEKMDS